MKRLLSLLLILTLLMVTVVGCKPSTSDTTSSDTSTSSEETPSEPDDESSSEEPSSEDEPGSDTDVDTGDSSYDEPPSEYEPIIEEEVDTRTDAEKAADQVKEGTYLKMLNAAISREFDSNGKLITTNAIRIANAIRKAQRGETVKIGFIGGTNTGNPDAPGYFTLVRDWWVNNFSGDVEIINAGLHTMTSSIAVYRLNEDLLRYNPDLVLVDFAVQDAFGGASKTNSAPFENLVRRILESSNKPGVIVLLLGGADQTKYSMNPANCDPINTAAKYELDIANYYKLPVIDFNNALWDAIYTIIDKRTYGEVPLLTWDDFAMNNVSLNGTGHVVLASMINHYLKLITNNLSSIPSTVPALPASYRYGTDRFMKANLVTMQELLEKTVPGYYIQESTDDLMDYGYTIRLGSERSTPSERCIIAYRPSKGEGDNIQGAHLNIIIPEVKANNPTYLLINNSSSINTDTTGWHDYSPVRLVFYDKNGNVISSTKPSIGSLPDAVKLWKCQAVRIPEGAVRVECQTYVAGGTIMYHGIAVENLTK